MMWKTTTSEPFCLTEGEGKSERKEERTETDVGTDGELGDQMNGGARREGVRAAADEADIVVSPVL